MAPRRDDGRVHLPAVGGGAAVRRRRPGRSRCGPTGSDIRVALRTAALLGGYRRLEDAQLALALVEVPALRDSGRRASPRQSREELRLTVHRFLVQEAQRIHAAVSPASDHGFLIVATRGSLARATDGFRVAPFTERARSELGVALEVGIGTGPDGGGGRGARPRLAWPGPGGGGAARARRGAGRRRRRSRAPRLPEAGARRSRSLETLARLAEKLAATDANLVVDAETAGQLLAVTPRTARRLLHILVEEGLAWPLPPNRTPAARPAAPVLPAGRGAAGAAPARRARQPRGPLTRLQRSGPGQAG